MVWPKIENSQQSPTEATLAAVWSDVGFEIIYDKEGFFGAEQLSADAEE